MKLRLRQIRTIVLLIACLLLAGGVGYFLGTHELQLKAGRIPQVRLERTVPADKQDINFSLFWEVWDRLGQSYLDKKAIRPVQMVYGAIKGMVASLGDPYTVFLAPEENKQAKEDLNGSFEGVGIELGFRDGQLAVIAPLEGLPAQRAGVKAGDLILKIEEREAAGMTLPEAVKLIRGPKGTTVRLTLLHQGEKEPYEVAIIRETIVIPSVKVEFLDQIAHLQLLRFGERTNQEWNQTVFQILNHDPVVKGIVLDLRNNPGGYLSGAVFIGSEFLPSGVVVKQESASGAIETFSVDRRGKLTVLPLVVLVNQGSASASEIVAGSLQEHNRAKVVGEKTFGKGTIQEAQDLVAGSGLHVTVARWLLPSGKSIDKMGITPDFEVKDNPETQDTDEQLQKALTILQ